MKIKSNMDKIETTGGIWTEGEIGMKSMKNKNYCNCNTMFAGIYIYLRSDQYCKLSQHFL